MNHFWVSCIKYVIKHVLINWSSSTNVFGRNLSFSKTHVFQSIDFLIVLSDLSVRIYAIMIDSPFSRAFFSRVCGKHHEISVIKYHAHLSLFLLFSVGFAERTHLLNEQFMESFPTICFAFFIYFFPMRCLGSSFIFFNCFEFDYWALITEPSEVSGSLVDVKFEYRWMWVLALTFATILICMDQSPLISSW